jgi:hypothetical protein
MGLAACPQAQLAQLLSNHKPCTQEYRLYCLAETQLSYLYTIFGGLSNGHAHHC